MTVAHLVATISAPLSPTAAATPEVPHWLGHRLLTQRGDTELVAVDLDALDVRVRFPAPWPRRFGTATVSPERDMAVFAGTHAVRCVDATGAMRWEVRHGCWAGCGEVHTSFTDYADDEDHAYPDHGSVAVSPDGKLVWAHVSGPLTDGGDGELWLVLDAADGTVLGRAETGTVASASYPAPHPEPGRMGLSVAEGEEGSPALWGRWDGRRLTVTTIDDELVVLGVSPSGRLLLAVDIGQYTLYLRAAEDGAVVRELDAEDAVPPHPESSDGGRVFWDFDAAFVAEDTVVAGTSASDAGYDGARHWHVDVDTMTLHGVSYPFPVSGPPRSAGNGTWYTVSADKTAIHLWTATPPTPTGS